MRCAVLGASGQLGRQLAARLPGEVHALSRADVDLTRGETLERLRELRPDLVVNCAAYNHVDRAECETDVALAVNAHGVRALALLCRDLGCTLVHFSTDYVFGQDRRRRTPYLEADAPEPVNVYGRSKCAGEVFVRDICPRHLVIRTCGLYGAEATGGKGRSFATTMLHMAAQGKPLRVVDDQTCTPTYTPDLAEAVVALVSADRQRLFHITNSGACTWFEFARTLFDLAGLAVDLQPISSADFGAMAERPQFSVLGTVHADLPPAARLRPWRESLADYVRTEIGKAT